MKRIYKIFGLFLILVASVCLFAACNGTAVQSIALSGNPQTVFVQGNDLDLSAASLTVEGKETYEVGLDDPEVQITGYDKNALGKQEITISYRGASTTLEVVVAPRFAADNNCVKDYFIGETFDRSKGKLVITEDDGSSFSVSVSDETLTVLFDSSVAGQTSVEVSYRSGSTSYSGSFTVNVYEVSDISLTKPSKIAYKSHETELDLSGGYLTLTGNGGTLVRYVALTSEMVSGFDPSVVTIENRTEPVSQTVTVSYGGVQESFSVSITYSDISVIKEYANELVALDWSGSQPELTAAQSAMAQEAATLCLALSDSDRQTYLSEEEVEAVMRSAVVGVYGKWADRATYFSNTLQFYNGNVYPVATSYALTKTDLALLTGETEDELLTLTALLSGIKENYGDVALGDYTLADYLLYVSSSEALDEVISLLYRTVTAYEDLTTVPASWTAEGLTDYGTEITRAVTDVIMLDLAAEGNSRAYCYLLALWRSDYFEILYRYYYAAEGSSSSIIAKLGNIYLFGDLEELYYELSCAWSQLNALYADLNSTTGYITVLDTTDLIYHYEKAQDIASGLLTEGDELTLSLLNSVRFDWYSYTNVTFNAIIYTLRTTTCGYLYYMADLYGNADVAALWQKYLSAVDLYSEGQTEGEDFAETVKEMFGLFLALTPTEQYAFLSSFNPYYKNGLPLYALSVTDGYVYTYFSLFVNSVYEEVLTSEGAYALFTALLCAAEDYISSPYDEYNLSVFLTNMAAVKSAYGELSDADKQIFDAAAGEIYQKYLAVYEKYDENGDLKESVGLGEWEDVFTLLEDAVSDCEYMYVYLVLMFETAEKTPVYSTFLASYERVAAIADYILENAPAEVIEAYQTEYRFKPYGGDAEYTLEYAVYYFHNFYMDVLVGNVRADNVLWLDLYEIYALDGLKEFMAKAATLMINYQTWDEDITAEELIAAEKAFRELDVMAKYFFLDMESGLYYYWNGLSYYYELNLTEAALETADILSALEQYYIYYDYLLSYDSGAGTNYAGDLKETLAALWQQYETSYLALSEEDKAAFDGLLSEKAEYYRDKYAQATA